jgi:hypothetical protein
LLLFYIFSKFPSPALFESVQPRLSCGRPTSPYKHYSA